MKRPFSFIFSNFLFFLLFSAGIGNLCAQQRRPQTISPDSTDLVVRRLNFKGNDHVKSSTLEMLIRTHTNRSFLGIPGFTPWYYVWKLTKKFGEKPAYLNHNTVKTDLERITRYYNSIGFLEATADTNITQYDKKKVKVSFNIHEGKRSHIQSVAYTGLPDSAFKDHQAKIEFFKQSDLTIKQINDSTFKADMPYLENELDLERQRVVTRLKNNGYAAIQPDSVTALIKRNDKDKHTLDVLYSVTPGKKYTFGDVHIKLAGPGTDTLYNYQESDTLQGEPYTLNGKKIYLQKEESAQTRFSLLNNQLIFKPGDTFDNERYIRTVNEFQNLGMMSIQQFSLAKNGSSTDYSKDQIPVYFQLQTLPKHKLGLNVFGMKRYGFGSGAGVTYTDNNLFGKAENLQLSVNGSFEYVSPKRLDRIPTALSDSLKNTTSGRFFQSFEARADYTLPRLVFPFSSLDNYLFFGNAQTLYSLSYSQSTQLLFDINADVSFNLQYQVKHNDRFTSTLDLLQLELIDTNPSDPFRNALKEEFKDDPFAYDQILEDFRPRISTVLRYSFRSENTDLIKRDHGYFSIYSISTGGNIPYLADRFIITPDSIEGNLPSPVRFSQNSLAYSQYVKATADYRRYIPLSNDAVFAFRGFGGYAVPYGKNRDIPLNKRFYAGGSNDIRGWNIYSLGPGSIPLKDVTINGGEIKLLGQAEIRQTFIKNFVSSNWILAWFTDAGNIWYGPREKLLNNPGTSTLASRQRALDNLDKGKFRFNNFYKQIAVGSGVGLRLDLNYLVFRFDVAFRIHDLQKGWFKNKKAFLSFGIGHSF